MVDSRRVKQTLQWILDTKTNRGQPCTVRQDTIWRDLETMDKTQENVRLGYLLKKNEKNGPSDVPVTGHKVYGKVPGIFTSWWNGIS